MHYGNTLLPVGVKSSIEENERDYLEIIESALEALDSSTGVVPNFVLEKVLTTVKNFYKLKYDFPVALRTRAIRVLMNTYFTKTTSFDQKTKILERACALLAKEPKASDYVFVEWKQLWNEALNMILKDASIQGGSTSNSASLSALVAHIIKFTHKARGNIPKQDWESIVEMSMAKFSDLDHIDSCEGVLLLLTCLPTTYDRYDEMLPKWVEIWSSINHNSDWDSCWLTLLCRARKYTKTFDWLAISPLLQMKARELMCLPAIANQVPKKAHWPLAFPRAYLPALNTKVESNKIALNKLAKVSPV